MICVSYTRALSETVDIPTIAEQNRIISECLKRRNLTISKKYSDRKQNPKTDDGFYDLKNDGISRKYDCVVFASIDCFGRSFLFGHNLLLSLFIPTGLSFISANDEFYSFEHSNDQIQRFLREKIREYKSRVHPVMNHYRQGIRYAKTTKFGYLRKDGENELTIDPASEATVRVIFRLASEGMTYTKISDYLNEHGAETCGHRLSVIYGKPCEDGNQRWHNHSVLNILQDPVYSGKWETKVGGETVILPCPSYLDESQQLRIIQDIAVRKGKRKKSKEREENILKAFVFDKESGENIIPKPSSKYGCQVYRFADPQRMELKYKPKVITVEELRTVAIKRIQAEKDFAFRVVKLFETADGKKIIREKLKAYREKARILLDRMKAAVSALPVSENETENSPEYVALLDNLDMQYSALMNEYEQSKSYYQKDNPWIKLYLSFDAEEFTSRRTTKRYLDRIVCDPFGNLEFVLREQEYKMMIPNELLMEAENGKKE